MAKKSTTEQRMEYVQRQKGFDPHITEENYVSDMIIFQNFHNRQTDSKVIRAWAIDYVAKRDAKKAVILNRASDFEIRSIGMIARAITRDEFVSLDHIVRIDRDVEKLVSKYAVAPKAVILDTKPVIDPAVKLRASVSSHIAEVDGAIDEYITKDTPFSMKAYVATNNVPGPVARVIGKHFEPLQAELNAAVQGKDEQLKEGYAFLGKVKLKRFLALVQQIVVDCQQQVVTAKIKKPRVQKAKPPSVVASKMKYLKAFPEMSLTSEKPETLIGAQTAWVYDTERRRLFVYTAEAGQVLGVKGTTITGFSVKESGVKTLRKPEEIVKGNLAKRAIAAAFKAVKTKQQPANGRVSEKFIILKVFL